MFAGKQNNLWFVKISVDSYGNHSSERMAMASRFHI